TPLTVSSEPAPSTVADPVEPATAATVTVEPPATRPPACTTRAPLPPLPTVRAPPGVHCDPTPLTVIMPEEPAAEPRTPTPVLFRTAPPSTSTAARFALPTVRFVTLVVVAPAPVSRKVGRAAAVFPSRVKGAAG